MGLRTPKMQHTVDDLARMPDDGSRYEIIDGELLVTPSPRYWHQLVLLALASRLRPYVRSLGLTLLIAPADVRVSRKTQVEPDLFVLPESRVIDHRTLWVKMRGLLLAIEALSPSTADVDRGKKRALYLAHGVPEYWIVDVDACTVEVWTAGGAEARRETKSLRWQPVIGRRALTIDLVAVFAEARGER
jgi:Uma2 family endonuclease